MSPRVRHVLLLAHRWAGLTMAGFLVMAGLTGSVLAFGDALDAALNPRLFRAGPAPSAAALLATVEAAERADPAVVAVRLLLPEAPGDPVRLGLAAAPGYPALTAVEMFWDPATGNELGRRERDGCCLRREVLVAFLLDLHMALTAGTPGRWLMGAVGLLWTADCITGLLLTLPRARPLARRWWPAWRVKPGASRFRFVHDLHRAGSLWCWVALFTVAFTGASLSLYGELFRPAVTALLPTTLPVPARPAPAAPIGFAAALSRAAQAWPGAAPRALWAYRDGGTVVVASRQDGLAPMVGLGPDVTVLDAASGAVLQRLPASGGRTGDLLMQLQYPLHSGQIAGLPGRLLVCLLGLATAGLSVTGVWIWSRKRAARRTPALDRPVLTEYRP